MDKFGYMEKFGHEQLCFFQDTETGLKAITCVHSTVLGPALGGSRFWNYATEEEAVEDVLRLARGMTYKNAMAGLPLGGGKTVIIGDAAELRKNPAKSEAFWRSFGRYLEGLSGRYITAEDMNTTCDDMVHIHKETENVAGLPGKSGNPSPYTALGVYKAMLACCEFVYGNKDQIKGKTVALQGLGNVGWVVCEHLHKAGAKLIVTDIDKTKVERAVKEFGATVVEGDAIYSVDCDIYAPCARGASVNDETIPKLKCKIICGAANNVLADADKHGKMVMDKGIIYAPDYVANAAGVINVSYELVEGGYNEAAALRHIDKIYDQILYILKTSKESGQPPHIISDKLAEERIEAVKRTKGIFVGKKGCC